MRHETRNVAVVGVGPVGTGEHGRGIPAVAALLHELSVDHTITVYSLLRALPAHAPESIRLRSLPVRTPWLKLDMCLLGFMIVFDHLRRRIDLLHALDAFPAGRICELLARLLEVPCLLTMLGEELSNLEDPELGRAPSATERHRTAMICESVDVVVVLTAFQARGLDELPARPRQTAVVPLGIDTSGFDFRPRRLEPPLRFLHVAHAHRVKAMPVVLEAFADIVAEVDAVLVVIGSGHIGGATAARVEALALTDRVRLIGPLPHDELPPHYRAAHFLLHASWYESQCVAFIEALACGAVVCSSDVGLAADLGADCCILVERGQPHVLARRVLHVSRDERRYRALQSDALDWCRAHDVCWTANEYRRLYRELAGTGDSV